MFIIVLAVLGIVSSLHTNFPTKFPTNFPTNFPTIISNTTCQVTNSLFANEFNSLLSYPYYGYDVFRPVFSNKHICEYIQEYPFSISETISNYTCSKEACLRWCSYNSNCLYSQYSNVTKTCIRSTGMRFTDGNKQISQKFYDKKILTMVRNTAFPVPYFSQLCNGIGNKRSCNTIYPGECAWDRGKLGYNNENSLCKRIGCKH